MRTAVSWLEARNSVDMTTMAWKVARAALACALCIAILPPTPTEAAYSSWFIPANASAVNNTRPFNATNSNITSPIGGLLDQTYTIGTQSSQDRLLLRETAFRASKWLRVVDADIVYPKVGDPGLAKIYSIKVIDQKRDGKNGEIKVKKGGVGENNVLLRFHSKRGESLHYLVEIYGH